MLHAFTACEGFFDHFKDKAIISELEYSLQPFDSIHVMDVFDVCLVHDTADFIKIVGDEDIIEEVKAKVIENTLELTNEYSVKWLKPKSNNVEIFVHYTSISKIQVSQTSFVRTQNPIPGDEFGVVFEGKLAEGDLELDCSTFYYWNNHPCGGKLTLKGNVNKLKLWNFALTEIDAINLVSPYALVDNYSQSHCWVKPMDRLDYSIHGAGNIYYSNNPELHKTMECDGTGELIKLD